MLFVVTHVNFGEFHENYLIGVFDTLEQAQNATVEYLAEFDGVEEKEISIVPCALNAIYYDLSIDPDDAD